MPRQIIVTHVGTSLLAEGGALEGSAVLTRLTQVLGTAFDHTAYLDASNAKLDEVLPKIAGRGRTRWLRDAPAELASLTLIGPQPGDVVVLLHSATPEGRLCGTLLAQQLARLKVDILPSASLQVALHEIEGLALNGEGVDAESDAATFVSLGLSNYIKQVWKYYDKRQAGDRLIFNVTGGYKGMIPIARDLALLLENHSTGEPPGIRTEVCYLFQGNQQIIRIGSLPISFGWDALQQLGNLLQLADESKKDGADVSRYPASALATPYFHVATDRVFLTPLGKVVTVMKQLLWP